METLSITEGKEQQDGGASRRIPTRRFNDMVQASQHEIDKFSMNELSSLRSHVIQGGLDTWQAAEMFKVFLACHGYGVSITDAIRAAGRVEGAGCTLEALQKELDVIAVAN